MKQAPQQIQAALNRIEKLSSAPPILARALSLMRSADTDITTIADLVRGDPALTADIIRISNSAYYGSGLPVSNVEHALQKIGFKEAMHLLTLAVSRIVTHQNLANYCITAEDFWKESLFHGLFMEELARATGAVEPAEAYTAGLLRYIGRLAINQAIQNLGGGLFWVGTEPLSQWEKETLGINHAEAGGLLLRRWKFTEELVTACEGQVSPAVLPAPSWMASALFFTASVLPQDFDQPFAPVLAPIADTDFLHPNQLTVGGVEKIFADTEAAYQKTCASFG
ncbi:MAG: HDOD domain-containing protein [Opitutales bacterium]